ncbi:MAG: hypothetical protein R3B69_00075 [Candidatus Paceibacterota bacterium]
MSISSFYDPRSFFQSEEPQPYRRLEQGSSLAAPTSVLKELPHQRHLDAYLRGDGFNADKSLHAWERLVRQRIKRERADIRQAQGGGRVRLPGTNWRNQRTDFDRSGKPIEFFRGNKT